MQRRAITHKFKAKPVIDDGHHFPSKLEHRYYQHLQLLQKAGEVLFFLRQSTFHLTEGRYICDFQVFYTDGYVEFIDVKGLMTPMSKLKIKQVEALYPVTIKIIKKGDF